MKWSSYKSRNRTLRIADRVIRFGKSKNCVEHPWAIAWWLIDKCPLEIRPDNMQSVREWMESYVSNAESLDWERWDGEGFFDPSDKYSYYSDYPGGPGAAFLPFYTDYGVKTVEIYSY